MKEWKFKGRTEIAAVAVVAASAQKESFKTSSRPNSSFIFRHQMHFIQCDIFVLNKLNLFAYLTEIDAYRKQGK